MTSQAAKPVRAIQLDDVRIETILDSLDAATVESGHNHRHSERYAYRLKGCIVHLRQPGDSGSRAYVVPTRDISDGGFTFLHAGYVHAGSACDVQLITMHGAWQDVSGMVAHCRYVQEDLHEVGVRFISAIQPANFCAAALPCRVLLADDDPSMRRLGSFLLRQLRADVDLAEDGRVAVEKSRENAYDVILMDVEMPELDGLAAVRELRNIGYGGMIVAVTAHTQPGDRERCLNAGCDDYLAKPIQREELAELVQSLREEPLFSAFLNDAAMEGVIDHPQSGWL